MKKTPSLTLVQILCHRNTIARRSRTTNLDSVAMRLRHSTRLQIHTVLRTATCKERKIKESTSICQLAQERGTGRMARDPTKQPYVRIPTEIASQRHGPHNRTLVPSARTPHGFSDGLLQHRRLNRAPRAIRSFLSYPRTKP